MSHSTLKGFFGFTRHPFPPACPPEPLYRPAALDAAIEQAKNALASRLSVLVTAPAGMGKSSFLRLLAAELNPREFRVARLTAQGVGPMELVRKLAEELGLETSARREQSVKFLALGLKRAAASGPLAVALIDEAQNVPVDAVNQLRLVAEETVPPTLVLVLVGDERFRQTLRKQAHAPLFGRLAVRIALPPLSAEETESFVAHAFKTCGMQNLLAPTAVAAVHAAAGGSPREIGAVVSRALARAFEKQSRLLTDEIVQEVLDRAAR
jgi:type II secretory pathway predicted ATPase ExeA